MNRKTLENNIRDLFPDAEDEQVSSLLEKIMAGNGKDISGFKQTIEENNIEMERLKAIESEYEAYKKSTMTAEEQAEAARLDASKAEAEYKRLTNRLNVERQFVSAGIPEEDYTSLLDSIVTEDAEASNASAAKLLDLLGKQKEAAIQATKEEMLKATPTPQPNQGNPAAANSFEDRYNAAVESGDMVLAASLIRQASEQQQINTSTTQ